MKTNKVIILKPGVSKQYLKQNICLNYTQRKVKAALEPCGEDAWSWSLLKGQNLKLFPQQSESLCLLYKCKNMPTDD